MILDQSRTSNNNSLFTVGFTDAPPPMEPGEIKETECIDGNVPLTGNVLNIMGSVNQKIFNNC